MTASLCEEDRCALFVTMLVLSDRIGYGRFCLQIGMSRPWWHRVRRAGRLPDSVTRQKAHKWCANLGIKLGAVLRKKRQLRKKLILKESLMLMCAKLENVSTLTYGGRRRLLYELNEALICDSLVTHLSLSREQMDSQRITVVSAAGVSLDLLISGGVGRTPVPNLIITPKDADISRAYAALAINASLYSAVLATIKNIIRSHEERKNIAARFDGAVAKKISAYHA